VGALGTSLPGSPVARFAAGSVPATGTSTSVFVVVFPHSLIKERLEMKVNNHIHHIYLPRKIKPARGGYWSNVNPRNHRCASAKSL